MKKLAMLSLLVFVPIIAGIVCVVVGNIGSNSTVANVGVIVLSAGIPATMFILVVVGLVLMITGKLGDCKSNAGSSSTAPPIADASDASDAPTASAKSVTDSDPAERDAQSAPSERDREMSDREEINSAYGFKSRYKYGEYQMRHTADNYKRASSKDKVLGWLFFAFLMIDFALILVFAFCRIMIGAIVCFCLFGGSIIAALIVTKAVEYRSMRVKLDPSEKQNVVGGTVVSCFVSSSTSTGGRRTTHIVNVVYRVIVNVDGKDYTAYSDRFYETGEHVAVIIIGKRSASIVPIEELREKTAEIEAETEKLRASIKATEEYTDELNRRIAERRAQSEIRKSKRAASAENDDESRADESGEGDL